METGERTVYAEASLELRTRDDGTRVLEGRSPIYNRESQVIREMGVEFVEIVRPGAVSRSLEEGDEIRARIEHQGGLHTIGSTTSGTLRLTETPEGVAYEVDLPDTTAANDLAALVERGDIRGSSFAFQLRSREGERWSERDDGLMQRELLDLVQRDVAPTGDPAYVDAEVKLRSLEAAMQEARATVGHRNRHRMRHLDLDEVYGRLTARR